MKKDGNLRKVSSLRSLSTLLKHDNDPQVKQLGVRRTSSLNGIFRTLSNRSSNSSGNLCSVLLPADCTYNERQIHRLREDRRQKRVNLKNFIQDSTISEVKALRDLIENDDRNWRYIQFRDTVQGDNYRRWNSKKMFVYKHLHSATEEKDVDIKFEGLMDISFTTMKVSSIMSLLSEIRKDSTVRVLKFSGTLDYRDVETIVTALDALLTYYDRPWNAVVFHASFGDDTDPANRGAWTHAMKKATRKLEDIAITRNIPIGVETTAT